MRIKFDLFSNKKDLILFEMMHIGLNQLRSAKKKKNLILNIFKRFILLNFQNIKNYKFSSDN